MTKNLRLPTALLRIKVVTAKPLIRTRQHGHVFAALDSVVGRCGYADESIVFITNAAGIAQSTSNDLKFFRMACNKFRPFKENQHAH